MLGGDAAFVHDTISMPVSSAARARLPGDNAWMLSACKALKRTHHNPEGLNAIERVPAFAPTALARIVATGRGRDAFKFPCSIVRGHAHGIL
ncbi:hypothetical protein [Bradyrhizobium sp.]|uniref:hypothetical protein n=1 Tax=Bradyrhizobium sp. TaxID=376 RepID=UPI003C65F566